MSAGDLRIARRGRHGCRKAEVLIEDAERECVADAGGPLAQAVEGERSGEDGVGVREWIGLRRFPR